MSPTAKKKAPTSAEESDEFAALSYEQARDELTDVVRALETGGTTLEESLALWERGEELARVCRARLDGARSALEKAMAKRSETGAEDRTGAAPEPDGTEGEDAED